MHLSLPRDAYETLKVDLREMVTLRNTLVHHFIGQYDLWAVDGCLRAQDALNRTYAEIDRHFDQLHAFAGHMDAAKLAMAELVRAPEFQTMLLNGIGPDRSEEQTSELQSLMRNSYAVLFVNKKTH